MTQEVLQAQKESLNCRRLVEEKVQPTLSVLAIKVYNYF